MDGDVAYVVSRNLVIRPTGPDEFSVSASISSPKVLVLSSSALDLLSCFATPATLDAVEEYAAELGLDRGQLEEVIATYLDHGCVRPADGPSAPVAGVRFASLRVQRAMLEDTVRVQAYRDAIAHAVRDKIVLEIGCGTGVLSVFAAQAGARRVYAIEETRIADVAEGVFHANDVSDRVQLLRGNSTDIELPERAEVLIHELIDTNPLAEDMRRYLADARQRLLIDDAVMLPERMLVCCRGAHLDRDPDPADWAALSDRYGVDFAPLADAFLASEARRPTTLHRLPRGADDLLTREARLFDLDFRVDDARTSASTELEVDKNGQLNAVIVYFRALFPNGAELTNAPLAPRTSWGFMHCRVPGRQVRAGERGACTARIEATNDGENIVVELGPT